MKGLLLCLYPGEGFDGGHGNGATQLIKHIRLTKDFSPRFTMQASRVQDLLNALRQDIMLRLRMTGTTVLGTHDDADRGVHVQIRFQEQRRQHLSPRAGSRGDSSALFRADRT